MDRETWIWVLAGLGFFGLLFIGAAAKAERDKGPKYSWTVEGSDDEGFAWEAWVRDPGMSMVLIGSGDAGTEEDAVLLAAESITQEKQRRKLPTS